MSLINRQQLWIILSQIPKGYVVTYGQLAVSLGAPISSSRVIGSLLKELPANTAIPWHRVINSKGFISFSQNSQKYDKQKTRLISEGIIFKKSKIDLHQYQWHGD